MDATHTHNGFEVTPVAGSRRRADGGGFVVDVRSNDPRTTATYWTAPEDQVLPIVVDASMVQAQQFAVPGKATLVFVNLDIPPPGPGFAVDVFDETLPGDAVPQIRIEFRQRRP